MNLTKVEQATGISNWSNYQLAVFDAVLNGNRNIVVQATAGSGKTTVLVAIANLLSESLVCRFLAFNKIIADELGERLPEHFPSSTIHSYGFSQLRKVGNDFARPDGYKLHAICDAASRIIPFDNWEDQERFSKEVRELINMARLCRVDVQDIEAMYDLAFERSLIYEPDMTHVYEGVLQVSNWVATQSRELNVLSPTAVAIVNKLKTSGWNSTSKIPNKRWIDFTDMVELPLNWGLVEPCHDFILWDEAQDGNSLYFEFVKKSLKPTGRLVAVGDDKQNIMGFGGAFLDGMTTIKNEMNALELPLSVSYRCPTSHVELANTVFPGTESPEWAVKGDIVQMGEKELLGVVQRIFETNQSILIMCRKNAPTVRFAMKLLQLRIPAKIKGRDFCRNVQSIVKKCAYSGKQLKRGFEFSKFDTYLYQWYKGEQQRLINKGAGEIALQALEDKFASIEILYSTSDARDVEEFLGEINSLFTDNGDKIQLASVHKSKGVEADITAILEYDTMPLEWNNQTPAQAHAEKCVHFVAVTRAKDTLYLC